MAAWYNAFLMEYRGGTNPSPGYGQLVDVLKMKFIWKLIGSEIARHAFYLSIPFHLS